jgi:hypothetical protein
MERKIQWSASSSQYRANRHHALAWPPEALHATIKAFPYLTRLELVELQSLVHTKESTITIGGNRVI